MIFHKKKYFFEENNYSNKYFLSACNCIIVLKNLFFISERVKLFQYKNLTDTCDTCIDNYIKIETF